MQLFLLGFDSTSHSIDVESTATVSQLKELIGASAEHSLCYGSTLLDESRTLADYDISSQSTIAVNARLLGGKVHGSLARAGKVRAQTPKVEKQDKKKKPKGRAFRRLQYTRRFINVQTGPGKKRGPNSNQ
ncbi:hypothetical protein WR25_11621 [Diploscapter pachys]|uniref:Ubiquitin-like domain-containing protein n=1 Tax=Diploscapter pachys TaxID=2018661 RepID=A0A2A2KRF9_9BILA|nr:hypothetical protein WR25_11621 [Diploscapter pachys]